MALVLPMYCILPFSRIYAALLEIVGGRFVKKMFAAFIHVIKHRVNSAPLVFPRFDQINNIKKKRFKKHNLQLVALYYTYSSTEGNQYRMNQNSTSTVVFYIYTRK